MGKATKATKKFQKNHLGRELTKRKHDQKKAAIREKSLAKYAPKEGEEDGGEEEEDGDDGPAAADETDVFSSKSKSNPALAGSKRKAPSASPTTQKTSGKPAPKKAPVIEDLDVDQFMDGEFLDQDTADVDDSAIDDEDDDEEDGADGGADDEDDETAALMADIEAHEAELANLENIDPEFFSHLKQHDKDLLKFNKKDLVEDEEDEDEDTNNGDLSDEEMGDGGDELEVLTMSSLKDLEKQCKSMSIKALKKLVRTFRSAIHIGSVSQARNGEHGGKKMTQSEEAARKEAAFRQDIQIDDPKVFYELVRFMMKEGTQLWAKHFAPEGASKKAAAGTSSASTSPQSLALEKHSRWNSLGPVLKAQLGHLVFFLSTLREGETNGQMARFVLNEMEGMIPFFEPFPKLSSKLLKELLELWSTSEHNVRIDAFLRIRQLAIELTAVHAGKGGENMLELTLKGIYLTYVRHTKFTSALTLPVIEFMANCVVEIYGIDPVLSYQHAFVYIRQLAIHLRQALIAKKKDSHRAVYNWNFINCLRVWSKVLSAHGLANSNSAGTNGAVAAQDNLHALVYPFVQISLGTLSVLPSSRYFPLRFHVCRFLIQLSEKTKVFLPLAPHLLAVFHAPELAKKPTSSTRKVNEIGHILKASKHVIATKTYQEAVVAESIYLLLQYFNVFSYSIAFNELILPTVKVLKKLSKDILVHRIRKQIQQFILKLEHNASWISTKRSSCNFAPKDVLEKKGIDGIDSFRDGAGGGAVGEQVKVQISPLDKYVVTLTAERKVMDDTKADWNGSKTPKIGKKKRSDDDSDEEDDEEEEQPNKKNKKNQAEEDDEDMDEDMDDDEDDDDEDAPPRKKSKSSTGAPHQPFEYPADADADGGDADQLEEFAFSDDEDEKPKKKKKPAQRRR